MSAHRDPCDGGVRRLALEGELQQREHRLGVTERVRQGNCSLVPRARSELEPEIQRVGRDSSRPKPSGKALEHGGQNGIECLERDDLPFESLRFLEKRRRRIRGERSVITSSGEIVSVKPRRPESERDAFARQRGELTQRPHPPALEHLRQVGRQGKHGDGSRGESLPFLADRNNGDSPTRMRRHDVHGNPAPGDSHLGDKSNVRRAPNEPVTDGRSITEQSLEPSDVDVDNTEAAILDAGGNGKG